jgi:hypothetical protein
MNGKKCTLIVQANTILVCIVGVWPRLFVYGSPDEAREIAYMIEDVKANVTLTIIKGVRV